MRVPNLKTLRHARTRVEWALAAKTPRVLTFDEAAYLAANPDVALAVAHGHFESGLHHYALFGHPEGRRSFMNANLNTALEPLRALLARAPQLAAASVPVLARGGGWCPVELLHALEPTHAHHVDEPAPLDLSERRFVLTAKAGPEPLEFRASIPLPAGLYFVTVDAVAPGQPAEVLVETQDVLGTTEAWPLGVSLNTPLRRMIRLPAPLTQLRVVVDTAAAEVGMRHVRLRRVSERFAQQRAHERLMRRGVSVLNPNDLWARYDATFSHVGARGAYARWVAEHETPANAELTRELSARLAELAHTPTFSVIVPVYNGEPEHLREALESVLDQSYPHWELCVADDASPAPHVATILREFAARDPRVRVVFRRENGHISHASNSALQLAEGEWVALLDHDDVLPRHALLRMVQALNACPDASVLYGDEDKLGAEGQRQDPHFKPDWDPDRLLGQNYVCHLFCARREHVLAAGGFRAGFEGSQDHDLALRLTDAAPPGAVVHVPHITYHWRVSAGSTASSAGVKGYTTGAGLSAVREAIERRGLRARAEAHPSVPNVYRVRWDLPTPAPRVTVIIPTRDRVELLRVSVSSVLDRSHYPALELLVVDNGSTDRATLAYMDEVALDPRVRILRRPGPFNFSDLNNAAAREATGQVLCLLNNDIEVTDPAWLNHMVAHAMRPGVGCVGANLLYPDGRLQHAGVVLGIGGVAGHGHKTFPGDHPGYFSQLLMARRVSAVTAACLVVRKSIWDEVGGLDEGLAVAFNDVDFCLRVREAGHANVITPDAVLFHHESASRGQDADPVRRERFEREVQFMQDRWGTKLQADPHYSPHLTLTRENFGVGR